MKTQKKKRGEIYKIARNKEWHSLISKKYRVVTSEWVMRRAVKSKESFGMTLNMGARTHQERSKRWECKLWIYCRERERERERETKLLEKSCGASLSMRSEWSLCSSTLLLSWITHIHSPQFILVLLFFSLLLASLYNHNHDIILSAYIFSLLS